MNITGDPSVASEFYHYTQSKQHLSKELSRERVTISLGRYPAEILLSVTPAPTESTYYV